ncbi:MAG: hypothetical protein KAH44_01235 [Oricola sp.]|nr:hypothetical protein [Oricola sp.]
MRSAGVFSPRGLFLAGIPLLFAHIVLNFQAACGEIAAAAAAPHAFVPQKGYFSNILLRARSHLQQTAPGGIMAQLFDSALKTARKSPFSAILRRLDTPRLPSRYVACCLKNGK